MTQKTSKAPPYPKGHILAASGIAALLSLALLVFPSREVEAKKPLVSSESEMHSSSLLNEVDRLSALTEKSSESFANQQVGASTQHMGTQSTDGVAEPDLTVAETEQSGTKTITAVSGDTLSSIFAKADISASMLHEVLDSSKEAKQLSKVRTGQQFEFKLSPEGKLEALRSDLSVLESIEIRHINDGFTTSIEKAKPEIRSTYARGVIDSSLFLAAKRAGLSHGLAVNLANIFAYDIDFAKDIRKNDEFEVIYEEKVLDGKRINTGNILAARFTNLGKTYTAVRYTNKQGATSYYTKDGKSLRKAFIRTPVDFARISSRFSNGRRHPILNKIRAHKGVDYAAPRGTPIKAAGDGHIQLAGRKGGYGNTVIIQHGNRYQTLYAHMQGFARGIRAGKNVKQGQIIGYIGTSGLSTGPHLHYEFRINGTHVDPLSQKLPMSNPIADSEKQRFQLMSQPLIAKLDQGKATMLAMSKPAMNAP